MPTLEALHRPTNPDANGLTACTEHSKESLIRCSNCGWVPLSECPVVTRQLLGRNVQVQERHSCGGNIVYMTTATGKQNWFLRV